MWMFRSNYPQHMLFDRRILDLRKAHQRAVLIEEINENNSSDALRGLRLVYACEMREVTNFFLNNVQISVKRFMNIVHGE